MKNITLAVSLLSSLFIQQAAANEQCGKVTIADMNWSSASLIANVDRFILEHGFGCEAELLPGDTMPTSTSMIEKGQPDIAPEMWSNSVKELIEKAVSDKRLVIAGESLSDGGEEGFWVPQYMVDKDPSLKTIAGVIANVNTFKHPEDPERGAFYGCPAGWGCQLSAENLYRALKLSDAGFDLIDPGSGAGLAGSIARAYEREKPWFGYYWAPTAVLGKYNMVKVDFGTDVDVEHFKDCTSQAECADPKVTMYPKALVQTVTTSDFAKKSVQGFDYLSKRAFTNAQMSGLLAWMEDNQADGDIAAEYFLTNYEDVWTQWVAADVAVKVKQAIKAR
ncbi:ABC transporter substrate-binding protein [Shewanella sp. D64]|uniref:ABC transporter substrate-binding protein n=1 Tax=unclassified Shewanella TaxID=196818 RepID=UPI0022BA629B|nr:MULTISPECIES: ABC transporter substrate-binding protein [unclassified Shewanella]MEC4725733.1 ABC transporter substrate-binding protein [Shewanella sp. D64]MEC4737660.1 ABC transporter substrate-binding protein [Shewanella sp. E94]WBJ93468.1 ABC transporter substrate-binding protein [Shewanella sp. MTB7]